MELLKEIKPEIALRGKISFARFMELALYHPTLGYYTSDRQKIGVEGDYFTSPDVHPAFGNCIGRSIAEMAAYLGNQVCIVEYGPGKGKMAAQILAELEREHSELFERLRYCLIEVSPYHRAIQRENLRRWEDRIVWLNSITDLEKGQQIEACIISNEFPDALPVHRVRCCEGKLQEVFVTVQGEALTEVLAPLSSGSIMDYLTLGGLELAEGQTVEVNLAALQWLEEIDSALAKGFIVTIDYGYLSPELQEPHRFDGTLLAYRQHAVVTNVYEAVGEQDITAHVNFSALISKGQALGWNTLGYLKQNKFLAAAGIFDYLPKDGDSERLRREIEAIKRLIMPEGMGETFKVLVQEKNVQTASLKFLQGW